MHSKPDSLVAAAEQLGLDSRDGDAVYGWFRGFPMAVTALGESGEHGLLIQIRHHLSGASLPPEDAYQWDEKLRVLIQDDQIKIDVEDKIAWLSIYAPPERLANVSLFALVDSVVAGLVSAGIESLGKTCHYCGKGTVQRLTYENGRVGQMCDTCLDDRRGVQHSEKQASAAGVAGCLVAGVAAGLVGAAIWAGCWIAHFVIVDALSGEGEGISVPYVVLILEVLVIGGLTGGATGFAISRIPRRGFETAALIGLACGVAGVAFGEFLFGAWIVRSFNPAIILEVIVVMWTADLVEAVLRGCAIVMCLLCSYGIAKPRLTPLGL